MTARFFAALLFVTAFPAIAGRPGMYLDQAEIDAVRSKVESGAEPWHTAFVRLKRHADKALAYRPFSVTFGGKAARGGDIHDYWTDAPYAKSRDGIINPVNDRTDYFIASDFSKAVRHLGLAWALTGDTRYAEKGVALLNAWMINPATRMNPRFTNGQSRIELSTAMPAAFYGADLLSTFKDWKPRQRAAVSAWARALGRSARDWSETNNFENWRHVLMASAGALTDDDNLLATAFDAWKNFLPVATRTDGAFVHELGRTKSLGYSAYALNAMLQTAEIARHAGVDLYTFQLPDGRGLERSLDYHAPYLADPSQWESPQITDYDGENAAIYELAYLWRQKPAYKKVIRRWGRPMIEIRVLGPMTLTHAFGAYVFAVSPRTPGR